MTIEPTFMIVLVCVSCILLLYVNDIIVVRNSIKYIATLKT